MTISTEETGPVSLQITVTNNGYSIEHFRGFFTAWLAGYGKLAHIKAESVNAQTDVYTVTWND